MVHYKVFDTCKKCGSTLIIPRAIEEDIVRHLMAFECLACGHIT